ncbi:MAG: hypothetical protein SVG88_12235 [Halobacteriales archaeon]|nr:hypothetical protein [Halobacteriales archaeon]
MRSKKRSKSRSRNWSRSRPLSGVLDRFEDTESGRRRRFFFAIGIANGLLSLVAAMTALMIDPAFWWITLLLIGFGICCFGFAGHIATGGATWLVRTAGPSRQR